jgi:hypothetical protein
MTELKGNAVVYAFTENSENSDSIRVDGRATFFVEDTSSMGMTISLEVLHDPSNGVTPGWVVVGGEGDQTAEGSFEFVGTGEQYRVSTTAYASGTATAGIKAGADRRRG